MMDTILGQVGFGGWWGARLYMGLLAAAIVIAACANLPSPSHAPTVTATLVPCVEDGTIELGEVPQPTQGFAINFQYYLPPCYATQEDITYPVVYLITGTFETRLSDTDKTPFSLTNQLIQSGKIPPVIIIVPSTEVGYGSDVALAKDLIPYVDSRFRTIRGPEKRGVGGISHGAAIAARMAFQFPEVFGSLGMLSGGIAEGEMERFKEWIERTPAGEWPRVRIDVGDQDGILELTRNLLVVLDEEQVPYTLNQGPGGHTWEFWSSVMDSTLLWFAEAWK
jgi:enterochelin esterase-like enzyme